MIATDPTTYKRLEYRVCHELIEVLQGHMQTLICATATGDERNLQTQANIYLGLAKQELHKAQGPRK